MGEPYVDLAVVRDEILMDFTESRCVDFLMRGDYVG